MDVSIIIVNYKTIKLVEECIQSVISHTFEISYEIIVVDNNSGDDVRGRLNDSFGIGEKIKVLNLSENLGFGKANNKGFKIANGRYFFCLNPDTILMNNAVKILADFLDEHPSVGACGGNLFDVNGNPNHSFRRYLPGFEWELNVLAFYKPEKVRYCGNNEFNRTEMPLCVGYITGADLMVRKSVIEQTHGFSPEFFMYFEETDLCYKIKKCGYDIVNVPQAHIIHLEGGSFSGGKDQKINKRAVEMSEFSRLVYYKKNTSKYKYYILNVIYMISLLINEFAFMGTRNSAWKYYEFKLKIFYSLLKGKK